MIDVSSILPAEPVRIIIGAGRQRWQGWIPTNRKNLDLLKPEEWEQSFRDRPVDAILCENVWQQLTEMEGRRAAELCYKYLKPGGYLRCAVPDGYFQNKSSRFGMLGSQKKSSYPSKKFKMAYNYRLLSDVFIQAGFEVDLLEYCDEKGRFHYHQWNTEDGPIYRSLMLDWRNQRGMIENASLIIDAKKSADQKECTLNNRPVDFFKIKRPHFETLVRRSRG